MSFMILVNSLINMVKPLGLHILRIPTPIHHLHFGIPRVAGTLKIYKSANISHPDLFVACFNVLEFLPHV